MSDPQDSDHTAETSVETDEKNGHLLSDDELVDELGEESFPASDPPGAF